MRRVIGNVCLALVVGSLSSCGGEAAEEDRVDTIASSGLARIRTDPTRPYAYVSDHAQSRVHFLNTGTYQVEKTVVVGPGPTEMEISGDGQVLFVMLTGASQVGVVDLTTQTFLGTVDITGVGVSGPTSIGAGPGRLLYVGAGTYFSNPHVQVHDVSVLPATQLQSFGGSNNVVAGVTANRAFVYTQDETTAPVLTQWSTASDPPVSTHTIAGYPYGGGNSPGSYMQTTLDSVRVHAVPDSGCGSGPTDSGVLEGYRTSDGLRVGRFDTELVPRALAFHPDGRAFATHAQWACNRTPAAGHAEQKDIHVFDGATFAEMGRYRVSGYVTRKGLAVTAGGALLFLLSDTPDEGLGSNENTAGRIGVIF